MNVLLENDDLFKPYLFQEDQNESEAVKISHYVIWSFVRGVAYRTKLLQIRASYIHENRKLVQ